MSEPSDAEIPVWLDEAEFLEALAAVEHERWSHWQRYLHQQCEQGSDGRLTIPAELVARWTEQMDTPYAALSDAEKDSDREQARQYNSSIRRFLKRSRI